MKRIKLSSIGPVLARAEQKGYVCRIHAFGKNTPEIDKIFGRRGRRSIQAPNGEIVVAGFWMDWPEPHYPKNYSELPKKQRAQLEVEEQKRYGYKHDFQFHRVRSPL